jgi:hypothetical protein
MVVALLGLVICIYLTVLTSIRCYNEWQLWELRIRIGQLDAELIEQEMDALRQTAVSGSISAVATVPIKRKPMLILLR